MPELGAIDKINRPALKKLIQVSMIKLVNQDQTKNIKEFRNDYKTNQNHVKLDTLTFYNELVTGEKGTIAGIGATMKVAFQLFQASKNIDIKTDGFENNADLKADCLNWVKDEGINYINDGYQKAENVKDKLIADYDNFKKDRPQLLRVLVDALPVACFLIQSKAPYSSDGEYFSEENGKRAVCLFISKTKMNLCEGMNDKFNKTGLPFVGASFTDLNAMTNYYYFADGGTGVKTSLHSANEKVEKGLAKVDKEGKLVTTNEKQLEDTLKSINKSISGQLVILDNHNRGDLITKVVEDIKQLTWFNTHCLPKQDIIFHGLISKDAIQINHVTNKKKVAIK